MNQRAEAGEGGQLAGETGAPGPRKVLVIGLDGATLDLLGPWIDSGELPNLRRLKATGAWGRLTTTLPPISASSWNSFITGMNPGKHGVVDFVCPARAGSDCSARPKVTLVDSGSRRTQALWDWLNEVGRTVGLLGIPVTYPPEPVKGFMVSGFLTPGLGSDWAYPPALKSELLDVLGRFLLSPEERYRSTGRVDRFLRDLADSVANRTEAALYLMRTRPWDLFAVVYWDTDMVQHETWRFLEPRHPAHDPAQAARWREPILAFHRQVDADVGRLVEAAGPEALVVVMSDHGFGPAHSFFLTNCWLASLGLLRFKNTAGTAFKRLLFRLGLTPLRFFRVARALGLGVLRRQVRFQQRASLLNRLFLSFDDVNWAHTQAFSVGSFGQIYINLGSARAQGPVQPGEEYERLRNEIAAQALQLRDPRSGEPVIERVYRREEIYHGPHLENLPDLLLQPRGWEYVAFGHADLGSNRVVEAITGLSGHHRPDGIILLAGRGVRRGTHLVGASILDLAPTLLHILGVAVPDELDGRVLFEAFEADSPLSRPVVTSRLDVYRGARSRQEQGLPLQEQEVQALRDRLHGWGYAE